jgi:uncharacterized oligopeptide transporter (OPT) family protein
MIGIGVALGVALIAIDEVLRRRGGKVRLPPLAVGLGIYLPAAVTTPVSLGALVAWLADRRLKSHAAKAGIAFEDFAEIPRRRGVLLASGLIVGESLIGVMLAGLIVVTGNQTPLALVGDDFAPFAVWLGGAAFVLACLDIFRRVTRSGPVKSA